MIPVWCLSEIGLLLNFRGCAKQSDHQSLLTPSCRYVGMAVLCSVLIRN